MGKLTIIVWTLFFLALARTGEAHSTDFFPNAKYNDNGAYGAKVWPSDTGEIWNTTWFNSIEIAESHWNVVQAGDEIHWDFQRDVAFAEAGCIFGHTRNTVRRLEIDPDGGVYGITTRCGGYDGNPTNHFYMRLDMGEPWYHAAGDDGVNNTVSVRGILTHEFGHASGFSPHFSDSTACDGSALSTWNTMCQGHPGGDNDEVWRLESLQDHDVHEYLAEY